MNDGKLEEPNRRKRETPVGHGEILD